MVEYTVTHKGNGEEHNILKFMGRTYEFTMIPCECGKKGNAPFFEDQVQDDFPKLPEYIIDALSDIDYETSESLELLQEWEGNCRWNTGRNQ